MTLFQVLWPVCSGLMEVYHLLMVALHAAGADGNKHIGLNIDRIK
jgi:hypothetical protein